MNKLMKYFVKTEDASWYQTIWSSAVYHAGDILVTQGIRFVVIGGDCIRRAK